MEVEAHERRKKQSKDAYDRVGWNLLWVRLLKAGWFGTTFEEVFAANFEKVAELVSAENATE